MQTPRFDPGGFYEFNLASGAVRTRDGERVVVVGEDTLSALVALAVASGDDLGALRALGERFGSHTRASLGDDPAGASPEAVLGHSASVLALFGFGRVSMERWGDAMVIRVASSPQLDETGAAAGCLLSGFFSKVSGRGVGCIPLGDSTFLLGDPEIADAVSGWAKQGLGVGEIIGRLAPEGA